LAVVALWLWLNVHVFPPVDRPTAWASKGIYGEKIGATDPARDALHDTAMMTSSDPVRACLAERTTRRAEQSRSGTPAPSTSRSIGLVDTNTDNPVRSVRLSRLAG
jgi:hypothetical protein